MINILVVEDDDAIRKALSMGISLKDSQVDLVQDGKTGIMLGKKKTYDVLLADLGLPDMDGFEVIRNMKLISPDIIPIVITGNKSLKSSIEAIRLEVSDYLIKPLYISCVENAINQGLNKRALKQEQNEKKLQEMLADYQKISIVPAINSSISMENETMLSSPSLSMFVHQINNPLTVINANAKMAMSSLDNKMSIHHYLEGIIRATASISTINEKIMAIEKTVYYRHERFDIKDIVLNCILMFEPLLEIKNIELVTEWTTQDCLVFGDQFSIEQVFKNLILNAVEAMGNSSEKLSSLNILIHISLTQIKVQLQDNGTGIAPDHMDNIFTPYFTTKKHGTGLGMSVVKKMVEEHQGTIEVKSTLGQGTWFTLWFPLADCEPYWH
ncbi:MAG: response regulator [Desulfobacula sp.]|jgi:signal transduction histidine kinase|nr:response regulator [Desulfobacula sp.]MBT6339676.1 response regulator [Desulfobacula sp.]MBT7259557.1 response regulator [Desulfobacula sp.]